MRGQPQIGQQQMVCNSGASVPQGQESGKKDFSGAVTVKGPLDSVSEDIPRWLQHRRLL